MEFDCNSLFAPKAVINPSTASPTPIVTNKPPGKVTVPPVRLAFLSSITVFFVCVGLCGCLLARAREG